MQEYVSTLIARSEMRCVEREVDPRFELAAVVERSQRESPQPILFRNVRGSSLPVVSNVYGSNQRIAEILRAPNGICQRWLEIMQQLNTANEPPTKAAPRPTPTIEGRIRDLPHITWREKDAGPYISAGVYYARDPKTGVGNLSFCRTYMQSDQELVCCIDPPHDLAQYQASAEQLNQGLDVAILVGAPPEVFIAACASVPIDIDEMKIASIIRGGPIETRRCRAIDLEVPIETEVVIEGTIRPRERRPEGPFGEYLGFYGAPNPSGYVVDVRSVYWRPHAIFHGLLCGSAEDLPLLDIAIATRTYGSLSKSLPGILDVACNPMMYCTIVKIDKQYEGHPKEVMARTFEANPNYTFVCIVVDKDVNIHDFKSVFCAYLTRGRVDRRIMVLADVPCWDRASDPTYAGRIGIDATMQLGREKDFERAITPGADSLDLSRYLAPARVPT